MGAAVAEAELLADARAALGEGPRWDVAAGLLVWVDILGGAVMLTGPGGEAVGRHELGRAVGAALPAVGGGWLLADALGFGHLGSDGRETRLLDLLAERPDERCNDAACDPLGRAWAGTLVEGTPRGSGTLYRLDPGPVASPVLRGLTVSNGLGWSPDGRIMWFADSGDRVVHGFDYDLERGELGADRHAFDLQAPDGVADGLTVDDEGAVWVAIWGGGAVQRYRPDGRLDRVVRVPATNVTSCAFGGADGATLFITTARAGRSATELDREPHAGGLFAIEPGVTGPPATPWEPDRAAPAGGTTDRTGDTQEGGRDVGAR